MPREFFLTMVTPQPGNSGKGPPPTKPNPFAPTVFGRSIPHKSQLCPLAPSGPLLEKFTLPGGKVQSLTRTPLQANLWKKGESSPSPYQLPPKRQRLPASGVRPQAGSPKGPYTGSRCPCSPPNTSLHWPLECTQPPLTPHISGCVGESIVANISGPLLGSSQPRSTARRWFPSTDPLHLPCAGFGRLPKGGGARGNPKGQRRHLQGPRVCPLDGFAAAGPEKRQKRNPGQDHNILPQPPGTNPYPAPPTRASWDRSVTSRVRFSSGPYTSARWWCPKRISKPLPRGVRGMWLPPQSLRMLEASGNPSRGRKGFPLLRHDTSCPPYRSPNQVGKAPGSPSPKYLPFSLPVPGGLSGRRGRPPYQRPPTSCASGGSAPTLPVAFQTGPNNRPGGGAPKKGVSNPATGEGHVGGPGDAPTLSPRGPLALFPGGVSKGPQLLQHHWRDTTCEARGFPAQTPGTPVNLHLDLLPEPGCLPACNFLPVTPPFLIPFPPQARTPAPRVDPHQLLFTLLQALSGFCEFPLHDARCL
ncbi:translation initiation factor IF-2-like [Penaeus monodon]|uniref:translation initiation factor IF-2-like n=1 Tax=Penaeus monodon TaxID=6687 RepID=UPI0018A75FFF|nr:translation initiation factor IF-2-like [Penaeus monodon]